VLTRPVERDQAFEAVPWGPLAGAAVDATVELPLVTTATAPSAKQPPTKRRPARLAALDGLRLIAALAVACYHLTVAWRLDGQNSPQWFLPTVSHLTVYGFLGVEVFFLISGFVIGMSTWDRSLGEFFTSRVSRLYPAYWACVLITTAVVIYLPIKGGVPISNIPTLREIAVNLTMLQEPLRIRMVDSVYYTLFVELRFYLLFAAVVAFGLTYRRAVIFCAVWMTVAVIAPALGEPVVNILAVPDYAPYFIAGLAAYLVHRFGKSPLLFGIIGFAWLLSAQRVYDRVDTLKPGFHVRHWPAVVIVTIAYAVILAVAFGWTNRITWRWLSTAGALTYPFYLLHQRIGYTLIRHAYQRTHLPAGLLITGTILLVLALAWLVHRIVEKPLSTWIQKALRRSLADLRKTSAAEANAGTTPRHRGDSSANAR
jgi:peptidoglycan/LPS O-acetylase OafA/YrhL